MSAKSKRRKPLPGDVHIPQEYQHLRGTQDHTGPMAQAVVVESVIPRFVEKVGLVCTVERTDDGWLYRITRPVVEAIVDGVEVGP
jgi:hypothetical protein